MGMLKKKVSISFRRNRWVVDWRDWDNNRHVISFKTEQAAVEKRLSVESTLRGDIAVTEQSPLQVEPTLIKKAIQDYTATVRCRRIGGTAKIEKVHFEQFFVYLRNECNVMFLHQVTTVHMARFQSELCSNRKASTVNRMFTTYRAFFNNCVEPSGLIAKNPMRGIKKLQEQVPDIKTWEPHEIENALCKLPMWAHKVVLFIGETGARPIELSRLIVRDLNMESKTVRLVSYKGGKTKEDFMPMSEKLFVFFEAHLKELRKSFSAKPDDLVFKTSIGTPVNKQNLGNVLKRFGITSKGGLSSYGLRHSFIDGLVALNVHARDVQLLARHSDFKTTTRYTHRNANHLRAAVNELSEERIKACVTLKREGAGAKKW